ncbi:DUF6470 family protein [Paenibacillus sp. NPDC058174]|uniref:DUF6470 family protein n=1 Tax=Paenibacillus sp. NPDC058174 TaxID=3346366 RepID=UPI0036DC213B
MPQIQIQSTPARIGIQSELGQYQMRQGKVNLNIKTEPTVIDIKTERPVLIIDQTDTWNALTGGKAEAFWDRIYNSYGQYAARYVENKTQEYDRIGDITAGGNPVADLARQKMSQDMIPLNVYGHASPRNVKFDAIISKPEVNVQVGGVTTTPDYSPLDIQYQRGKFNVYMEQYASVKITPPEIDLTI